MEMMLRRASEADSETLRQMQAEAFSALLARYQDYDINPACETAACIEGKLKQPETYYYFIIAANETVGAIRIVEPQDGSRKRISPLFILPAYRGRGFAQAAIRLAEQIHGASGWQLATILQEPGNCYLYEKAGYHRTGKTAPVNDRMTLVFYEKD